MEDGPKITGGLTLRTTFGPITLLGSGETSLSGGRIFESIAQRLPRPLQIAILETPAGFELNSPQVAGRVADFLKVRLQNYQPVIEIVPARKRNTPFSPEDPEVLKPLLAANLIFMGAGSPTYAARQLRGSLAWDIVRARHRLGAALVFASAATIAVGAHVLPVYEIYKVGEEISAPPGLDLFTDFRLPLSFVPHWNNTDGGADVDTSRCFIGMERFAHWCAQLPPGRTTIGLDEHTGLVVDISAGICIVSGVSSVTLLRECDPEIFSAGTTFPMGELGEWYCPEEAGEGIPASVWEMAICAEQTQGQDPVPEDILELVRTRQEARQRKDWAASDSIRQQILVLGWLVQDTPEGQKVVRQS
ncbi:MAG: cysteinyl-tRNA synthetase [Chloroflexi bacterium]|nr:cysteinyl-tRNA synthetase [Chloroflexota bacterium]